MQALDFQLVTTADVLKTSHFVVWWVAHSVSALIALNFLIFLIFCNNGPCE